MCKYNLNKLARNHVRVWIYFNILDNYKHNIFLVPSQLISTRLKIWFSENVTGGVRRETVYSIHVMAQRPSSGEAHGALRAVVRLFAGMSSDMAR